VAHGGVLMTLLDVAMAHAARSAREGDPGGGPGLATIEMKTSFLRAAEGRLVATGTVLHATTEIAFCEGSVRDATGAICAHATGTFKFVRALRRPKPARPAPMPDPTENPRFFENPSRRRFPCPAPTARSCSPRARRASLAPRTSGSSRRPSPRWPRARCSCATIS
jgi:uncharacterized protein (TIGR00369 family)